MLSFVLLISAIISKAVCFCSNYNVPVRICGQSRALCDESIHYHTTICPVSKTSVNRTAEAFVSCMIHVAVFPSLSKSYHSPSPPVILPSFPHRLHGNIDLRVGHNICTHHHLSTPPLDSQLHASSFSLSTVPCSKMAFL